MHALCVTYNTHDIFACNEAHGRLIFRYGGYTAGELTVVVIFAMRCLIYYAPNFERVHSSIRGWYSTEDISNVVCEYFSTMQEPNPIIMYVCVCVVGGRNVEHFAVTPTSHHSMTICMHL